MLSVRKPLVEKLHNPPGGIRSCRIIVAEVKSVLLSRIDDLLRWSSNRFGKLDQFFALRRRNIAVRVAMQFDQRRHMADLRTGDLIQRERLPWGSLSP